jgi:hypothetical protein
MYTYTKSELQRLDTLDQSWDGAELKILEEETRVWLVPRENRGYDGDYQVETRNATGKWIIKNYYF